MYNIPGYREVRSGEALKPLVARVAVPAFEPRGDVKIQTDEKAAEEGQQADSSEWIEQVLRGRCCLHYILYILLYYDTKYNMICKEICGRWRFFLRQ